jgi:hypothetical protein
MSSVRMKFKIDSHLKRYERALIHVAEASDEIQAELAEECLELVQAQRLYSAARKTFNRKSTIFEVSV